MLKRSVKAALPLRGMSRDEINAYLSKLSKLLIPLFMRNMKKGISRVELELLLIHHAAYILSLLSTNMRFFDKRKKRKLK